MKKVSILLAATLLLAGGSILGAGAGTPTHHAAVAGLRFPDGASANAFRQGKQDAIAWYGGGRTQQEVQDEYAYATQNRLEAESGSLEAFYWQGYQMQVKSYCNSGC